MFSQLRLPRSCESINLKPGALDSHEIWRSLLEGQSADVRSGADREKHGNDFQGDFNEFPVAGNAGIGSFRGKS